MDLAKTFVSGVVIIGLVTAFGLHASGLSKLATAGGKAGGGLLHTAETGKK
jgi:hypothetical protein